jgi:hypothetical protein
VPSAEYVPADVAPDGQRFFVLVPGKNAGPESLRFIANWHAVL